MYAQAVRNFERAVRIKETVDIYNHLGLAYMRLRRLRKAEKSFRRALELDPSSSAARRNLKTLKNLAGEEVRRQ